MLANVQYIAHNTNNMSDLHLSLMGTALYGMKGTGKTTLGNSLARRKGRPFTDTDTLIERAMKMTCREIIDDPELDFGIVQQATIMAYSPKPHEVIATGGSVAMYPSVVGHLARSTIGVFINVDPTVLEARIGAEGIAALNNPDNLDFYALCERRSGFYRDAARLVLDVPEGETPEDTLERLILLRASA